MKYFGEFLELPIAAVRPAGWLRQYLSSMSSGLTGHIEHAGRPFNTDGWQVLGKYGLACDEWGPYRPDRLLGRRGDPLRPPVSTTGN